MFVYRLLSQNMCHGYCSAHELLLSFPSVSVSILYCITIWNVPALINQVKFLHLLYPTQQIKSPLFLLLRDEIQCISLSRKSGMPAEAAAPSVFMLCFYVFRCISQVWPTKQVLKLCCLWKIGFTIGKISTVVRWLALLPDSKKILGLNAGWGLSVWSMHIHSMLAWVSFGQFLPAVQKTDLA